MKRSVLCSKEDLKSQIRLGRYKLKDNLNLNTGNPIRNN